MLDFKHEVGTPAKVASAITALTVNGGVLLYGVDEDERTRTVSALNPIKLDGVEERLRNIAGTRIEPTPDFTVELIANPADETTGVVVVEVPASPLAPHLCDHRYPVRRGTTTDYLVEREVERLYHQRQELSQRPPSVDELLQEFQAPPNTPLTPETDVGALALVVRPAFAEAAHPAGSWQENALKAAVHTAARRAGQRFNNASLVRSFNALADWGPLGTVGWYANVDTGTLGQSIDSHFSAAFTYPARLSFLARWALAVGHQGRRLYRSAREIDVVRELVAMLSVAGEYFAEVDGGGHLLAAISLRGFKGGKSQLGSEQRELLDKLPDAPDGVRNGTRASAAELRDHPERAARRLIENWLPAFFKDPSDPDDPRDLFDTLVPPGDDGS